MDWHNERDELYIKKLIDLYYDFDNLTQKQLDREIEVMKAISTAAYRDDHLRFFKYLKDYDELYGQDGKLIVQELVEGDHEEEDSDEDSDSDSDEELKIEELEVIPRSRVAVVPSSRSTELQPLP